MAKRTNIIRIIKNEMEKGNTILTASGNFVSPSLIENSIKEDFIKALRNEEIDISKPYEIFKQEQMTSIIKAEDILNSLVSTFQFDYKADVPKDSEQPKTVSDVPKKSEPSKDKKALSKAEDTKKGDK